LLAALGQFKATSDYVSRTPYLFGMWADTDCTIAESVTLSIGTSHETAKSGLSDDLHLLDENTRKAVMPTAVRAYREEAGILREGGCSRRELTGGAYG
jgi:hypothetical protein